MCVMFSKITKFENTTSPYIPFKSRNSEDSSSSSLPSISNQTPNEEVGLEPKRSKEFTQSKTLGMIFNVQYRKRS